MILLFLSLSCMCLLYVCVGWLDVFAEIGEAGVIIHSPLILSHLLRPLPIIFLLLYLIHSLLSIDSLSLCPSDDSLSSLRDYWAWNLSLDGIIRYLAFW